MHEPRQVHPTRNITKLDGTTVAIDEGMTDLVSAIWALGLDTAMCCQNAGESLAQGGAAIPPDRWNRYAAFYADFAWLTMPTADMQILLSIAEPLRPGNGWASNIRLRSTGPLPNASLHFPARQITELCGLLC
ncbi:hypothetical protein [Actinocorallia sp. A-T 12471]|uniref:hypothetical protein n=1 Tax=Actinocorallia sp. A-T 12471 TaxID=3089813 RepID=UPI0029CBA4E1|nr:hypothetical protein [Actinocorallia sp. A-T 12471]MDX6739560.1 hypothetical protein [Actinocorallia sp. A-T 12471]